jgi:hypothetical protein
MAEFTDQEKDKIEQEIHAKFLLETQLKIFIMNIYTFQRMK